jgi:hypothetical protein
MSLAEAFLHQVTDPNARRFGFSEPGPIGGLAPYSNVSLGSLTASRNAAARWRVLPGTRGSTLVKTTDTPSSGA